MELNFPPRACTTLFVEFSDTLDSKKSQRLTLFQDAPFVEFRMSLDAEMKCLQWCGLGSKRKKAEPITSEEEKNLWQRGILGSSSPQSLVDTMLYMNGFYFALTSGGEHRQLRFHQSQIQLIERPGERSYLQYTGNVSRNRQGGLKNRKMKPKVVLHYANDQNPNRCFIHLFKLYKSLCPTENLKKNSFYLQPLKNRTSQCWYSVKPISHDTQDKMVARMCSIGGIGGYRGARGARTSPPSCQIYVISCDNSHKLMKPSLSARQRKHL